MRRRGVLPLLLVAAIARADYVVDGDGDIRKGSVSVRREEGVVEVGRREIPLAEVYLVEDDEGKLLYAPDFEARVRGYEYLASDDQRREYVKLVREAVQVDDIELAYLLLEKAERAGVANREAVKLKLKIEGASDSPVRSDRLRREMREVDAVFSELLANRARVAIENGDPQGARLLREALRRGPASKSAQALLGRIAPESFPLGDARAWLDWTLDLEQAGADVVAEHDLLEGAQTVWREDLHAVHGEPILLITPVRDSRLVGRCLAFGRLGCRALAEMFRTDAPVRNDVEPMPVFLFENKEEYATRSGTGRRVENPAFLQWTAGYFSPHDGISRFYWTSDPDAERRLVGTLVHELTHHWLAQRNPRVKLSPMRGAQPGFWIVEGFATLMEEGLYDAETQQWDLFNPRARTLDVIASLARERTGRRPVTMRRPATLRSIIPWRKLYALNQGGFAMLPPDNEIVVAMRWNLRPTIVSSRRMFYEQAGATCQFLYHAESGKYRRKLIEYVCNYYAGETRKLDPRKAFGLDADELGKETIKFAKSVAAGWKPGGG